LGCCCCFLVCFSIWFWLGRSSLTGDESF